MTDPRILRTRARLRARVLSLASRQPVEQLSVTDICKVAHVSRATFYRHAKSPAALLSDAIDEKLEQQRLGFLQLARGTGTELQAVYRRLIASLVDHVEEFADAYALSMPQPDSALRAQLGRRLHEVALEYVTLRAHEIELLNACAADEQTFVTRALARDFADGQLGVIHAWVETTPRHREALERMLLLISPAWNLNLLQLDPR